MLAVISSVIQRARTGVTGSASAARVGGAAGAAGAVDTAWSAGCLSTSLTGAPPGWSAKALALTPVGGHRARGRPVGHGAVLDQVVVVEALGQLAGLGV